MPMPILKESIQQLVGRHLRLNTRKASLNSCWTIIRTYMFVCFLILFVSFLFSNFLFLIPFYFPINIGTKRTNAAVIQHDQSASLFLSKPSKRRRFKAKGRHPKHDLLSPILNTVESCTSLKVWIILVSDCFVRLFFDTN